LCYARFAKTRAVAQALVEGGKVRVNRERVTHSSRLVRTSDVLTIRLPRDVRVVRVLGFSERRVSPKEVSGLYEVVDSSPQGDR
jgi:ribosome-associated heat shock protein Hsp15